MKTELWFLETIESFKYNIPDGSGTYVETTAPAVTATPLTHEPVVEYIDNVVQNVKDLMIIRLDGKPPAVSNEVQSSTYASAKAQVELVEKELRALRNFVFFLRKICSSEQQDAGRLRCVMLIMWLPTQKLHIK
ncbi:hypothetical protein K7X08_031432 [Anisodus acutangulus]|uniref:Late blight resistance protein R1A-like N-terminal domain-containing protein n=1 Tax=Anisodus acutangulus TaxID=402998 RepID=A0A9Q1ML26_9SOLA|nr:hypothetical protein K7X08_031432 [Anisodus acutangulus]